MWKHNNCKYNCALIIFLTLIFLPSVYSYELIVEPNLVSKIEYNVNVSVKPIYTEIVVENGKQFSYNYYYIKLPNNNYNRLWSRLSNQDFMGTRSLNVSDFKFYAITNKELVNLNVCEEYVDDFGLKQYDCNIVKKMNYTYIDVSNPTSTTSYLEWFLVVKSNAFQSGSFNFSVKPLASTSTSYLIDPDVSACGTLSTSNTIYTLTANLSNTTGSCLTVTGSNVTIEGAGYWITGNNSSNNYGIVKSLGVNLTINNINIRNYTYGMRFTGTDMFYVNNSYCESSAATNGCIYTTITTVNNVVANTIIDKTNGQGLLAHHLIDNVTLNKAIGTGAGIGYTTYYTSGAIIKNSRFNISGGVVVSLTNIINVTFYNNTFLIDSNNDFINQVNVSDSNFSSNNFTYIGTVARNSQLYDDATRVSKGLYFFDNTVNENTSAVMFSAEDYGFNNSIIDCNGKTMNNFYNTSSQRLMEFRYIDNMTIRNCVFIHGDEAIYVPNSPSYFFLNVEIYNNTFRNTDTVNGQIYIADTDADEIYIYDNNFSAGTRYIYEASTGDIYLNKTEGNVYAYVLNNTVKISGNTMSTYYPGLCIGNNGTGYPYNSTTDGGTFIDGTAQDFGALTNNCTVPSYGNLSVLSSVGGTAVGNSTNFVTPSNKSINATSDFRYYLYNWSVVSGNCSLNSVNSSTNWVYVLSGECVVQANFYEYFNTNGLLGCYDFNNANNTFVPDSTNRYNGTGEQVTVVSGLQGNGMRFYGTSNRSRVNLTNTGIFSNNVPTGGNWSITGHVLIASNTSSGAGPDSSTVIYLRDRTDYVPYVLFDIMNFNSGQKPYYDDWSGSVENNFNGLYNTYANSTWYSFAIIYNESGNNVTLYINDIYAGSTDTAGTMNYAQASGVYLGGRDDQTRSLNGTMDTVTFWNRTLTRAEVTELYTNRSIYNCTFTVPPASNVSSNCSYVSGEWFVSCNEQCNVSSNVVLTNNNITFYGNGLTRILANISGWKRINIWSGCNVSVENSGGFR